MRIVIIAIVGFFLASCSPEKRLSRLLDKHPELSRTVTRIDTVITDSVVADTQLSYRVLSYTHDTVILRKDRLEIRTFVRGDSIYIDGKCQADTIIRTVPVREVVQKMVTNTPNWMKGLICLLILTIVVMLIAYYARK